MNRSMLADFAVLPRTMRADALVGSSAVLDDLSDLVAAAVAEVVVSDHSLDPARQVKVFAVGGSTEFVIDVNGYYL